MRGKKLLSYADIESADLEASALLAGSTGIDKLSIFTEPHKDVSDSMVERYNEFLNRRLNGEPYAYITGTKEFLSLEFKVNPGVLIPRPETELLVESALEKIPDDGEYTVVDAGTGSGCIGICIGSIRKNTTILGTEISYDAVKIANNNSILNNTAENCTFINSEFLTVFKQESIDMIISNPPYIRESDFDGLQAEVKDFEPEIALLGGEDGLDHIRKIAEFSMTVLKQGGWLLFEIGIDQSKEVVEFLSLKGFKDIKVKEDYNGIDRVITAQWKKY